MGILTIVSTNSLVMTSMDCRTEWEIHVAQTFVACRIAAVYLPSSVRAHRLSSIHVIGGGGVQDRKALLFSPKELWRPRHDQESDEMGEKLAFRALLQSRPSEDLHLCVSMLGSIR